MGTARENATQLISCPSCKAQFPLTEAISVQLEQQFERRLRSELNARDAANEKQRLDQVAAEVSEAVAKERKSQNVELVALRQEVTERGEQVEKLQKEELTLRQRAREVESKEKALELETMRRLQEQATSLEQTISARLSEEHRLKQLEKDKSLADLQRKLEEAMRQAKQGSQQLQGEALEGDLEVRLRGAFPYDRIEAVANGACGADLIQHVRDAQGRDCGEILWETKNTKAFSEAWLAKLRADQRERNADLAVIVTAVLPKGAAHFCHRGGVWVTGSATCLSLAQALRNGVLQVASARGSVIGRSEKQELLFQYCSGVEFRQRVEAVLEPALALHDEHVKEKRATQRIWAAREKHIEKMICALAGLHGDVGGLVGGTLAKIERLELPSSTGEAS